MTRSRKSVSPVLIACKVPQEEQTDLLSRLHLYKVRYIEQQRRQPVYPCASQARVRPFHSPQCIAKPWTRIVKSDMHLLSNGRLTALHEPRHCALSQTWQCLEEVARGCVLYFSLKCKIHKLRHPTLSAWIIDVTLGIMYRNAILFCYFYLQFDI